MPAPNELFSRNVGALTEAQQAVIQRSSAAVIGCGGLGGYVVEELVRTGLGHLQIFDPDVFSVSNSNRQLYALQTSMGHNKAEVAARRARTINPHISVHAFPQDFRQAAAQGALQVDVVIDCLDEIPARLDLAQLCLSRELPLVHAAVCGWYGQVGVQLPGTDLIAALYSHQQAGLRSPQSPSILSFTVAVLASLEVCEAVKLLLQIPSPLHNRCMQVDLKYGDFQLIT